MWHNISCRTVCNAQLMIKVNLLVSIQKKKQKQKTETTDI